VPPTFRENFGAAMHIVRHHKVYSPKGTYEGGREKAPSEPSIRLEDGLARTYRWIYDEMAKAH